MCFLMHCCCVRFCPLSASIVDRGRGGCGCGCGGEEQGERKIGALEVDGVSAPAAVVE